MNTQIEDYLIEPLVTGLVAMGISYLMHGNKSIPVGSRRCELYKLAFPTVFAGKVVDNLISQQVFPHIIKDENRGLNAPVTEALSIATIAGTTSILHYYNNKKSLAALLPSLLAEAAGAEIGGQYISRRFVIPLMETYMA